MISMHSEIPKYHRIDDTGKERRRNEDQRRRNAVAKITLADALGIAEINHGGSSSSSSSRVSRTLHDIIRDESHEDQNKNNWKSLKGCLRRRAGAPWTSSVHIPTSDVPTRTFSRTSRLQSSRDATNPSSDTTQPSIPSPPKNQNPPNRRAQISRLSSTRFPTVTFESPPNSNVSPHVDSNESPHDESNVSIMADEGVQSPPPVRVSLMSLLEETDRKMGVVGPVYGENQEGEEDEEEKSDEWEDGNGDDDGGDERRRGEFTCCVCMVRHKGAAFIPCGHTFCRLCSRELWVSRGNCPICNGFILEILNIF